jgi:N-ethylmaleimide reductase
MKTLTTNKLFTPMQVGPMKLEHRVVMAPLTRSWSVQPGAIPGDLMGRREAKQRPKRNNRRCV